MKKFISFILIVILVLPISVTAKDDYYIDSSVTLLTPASFNSYTGFSSIDAAVYSYRLYKRNENSAYVSAEFSLICENQEYFATAEGMISGYQLPNVGLLWEGPLNGFIDIDGSIYQILVGFTKNDSSSDVQFCLTLQNADAAPVMLSFGDNVMSVAVCSQLDEYFKQNEIKYNEKDCLSEINCEAESYSINSVATFAIKDPIVQEPGTGVSSNIGPNGEYDWIDQSFALFVSDEISGYGLQSRTYFAQAYNEFIITTHSYCSNVDALFEDDLLCNAETYVSKVWLSLEMKPEDRTTTNAVQMQGADYEMYEGYDSTPMDLSPLFDDLTSWLGIGSSTLSALYEKLVGTLESSVTNTSSNCKVSLEFVFGVLTEINFDDSAYCIPVTFPVQIASESYYEGDSVFTITHGIQYRSKITDMLTGNFSYYYWNSEEVCEKVTVDLG